MKKLFSLLLAALIVASAAIVVSARKTSGKQSYKARVEMTQSRKSEARRQAEVKRRPASRPFIAPLSANATSTAGARHAVASRADDIPTLYGVNAYSDEEDPGIYRIPTSSDEEFEAVMTSDIFVSNFAGVEVDGTWYQSAYDEEEDVYTLYTIDLAQKKIVSSEETDIAHTMCSVTKDPTTGDIYALIWDEGYEYQQICKVTFEDGSMIARSILDLDDVWTCIVADSEGLLYGIQFNGSLYQFDLEEEEINFRGATGFTPNGFTGAVIDPKTDKMYWTVFTRDFESYLAEVNLANGSTTTLREFTGCNQINSLYIADSMYAPGTPAAAEGLTADFPKGGTDGTIEFTAPTLLADGSAAQGQLSYTIEMEYDEETSDVATGTAAPGAKVSVPVSVDETGSYVFSVYCSTAEGAGPRTSTSVYVGYGTPSKPVVKAELTDAGIVISWEPVTTVAGQGYIDPEAVTYTVRRVNDNKVLAQETSETSVVDPIEVTEELKLYSYTVVAHNDERNSATVTTEPIKVGSFVKMPFNETFESKTAFDLFTVVDTHNDGSTWEYYNRGHHARAIYNSENTKDDWLITPPLRMTAASVYNLAVQAWATRPQSPEIIEIKMGKEPTAEGMTTVLVQATDLLDALPVDLAAEFRVEEDGVYYVGFHAISVADMFNLMVDNIHISETTGSTPKTVSDLAVVPDLYGALKTELSFTAPTQTVADETISKIDKIEISRDDKVIGTIDATPGQACSFTDNEVTLSGNYTYSVVVVTPFGHSEAATQTVHVGYGRPALVSGITAVETTTPGTVHLSWDALNKDIDGKIYPDGTVTYALCVPVGNQWGLAARNISATEIDWVYQSADAPQSFSQIAVMAYYNGNVSGPLAVAPLIPVGPAYENYSESFEGADLDHPMVTTTIAGDAEWSLITDGDLGINSQDADNGFTVMYGSAYDASAAISTGNISLAGVAKPVISFWTYNLSGELSSDGSPMPKDENLVEVQLRRKGEQEWKTVVAKSVDELCEKDACWNRVMLDISEYAGSIVQLNFVTTIKTHSVTAFDNITVGQVYARDVVAEKFTAPSQVAIGSDYNVQVVVANDGYEKAEDIVVKLLANGNEAASQTIAAIEGGQRVNVDFALTMSPLAEEPIVYSAVVTSVSDENTANNTTAEATVAPRLSKLPTVTDLAATSNGNGVDLQWTAPDLSAAPMEETVTEDFENADSWADYVDGWQFVDQDGLPLGGLEGLDFPNHPAMSYASFWVQDDTGYDPGFKAHSGHKYLISSYAYADEQVDDWAISPRLSGEAQTISFYARSLDMSYREVISVYYSTEDTDEPSKFSATEIQNVKVPAEWSLCTVNLPEGATYFAVRSHAAGGMMLMLDDFTFSRASEVAGNAIVGYDIYRGESKVNEQTVVDTKYFDSLGGNDDTYQVVVVYERGMSAGSNKASASAGIGDISVDDAPAEYYNLQGIRIAEPAEGQLYIKRQGAKASKIMK